MGKVEGEPQPSRISPAEESEQWFAGYAEAEEAARIAAAAAATLAKDIAEDGAVDKVVEVQKEPVEDNEQFAAIEAIFIEEEGNDDKEEALEDV